MGDKFQAVGFIGILIAGSCLDSKGWIWGLVFLTISASIMEVGYRLNKSKERRGKRHAKVQTINKRRKNDLVKERVSACRLYDTQ